MNHKERAQTHFRTGSKSQGLLEAGFSRNQIFTEGLSVENSPNERSHHRVLLRISEGMKNLLHARNQDTSLRPP